MPVTTWMHFEDIMLSVKASQAQKDKYARIFLDEVTKTHQIIETKSSQRLGSCLMGLEFQFRKMKNSKRWTVMMAAQQCE